MAQGGIVLLSVTAADAEDPQTLRMVAGAIANLCGNGDSFNFISIFGQAANATYINVIDHMIIWILKLVIVTA